MSLVLKFQLEKLIPCFHLSEWARDIFCLLCIFLSPYYCLGQRNIADSLESENQYDLALDAYKNIYFFIEDAKILRKEIRRVIATSDSFRNHNLEYATRKLDSILYWVRAEALNKYSFISYGYLNIEAGFNHYLRGEYGIALDYYDKAEIATAKGLIHRCSDEKSVLECMVSINAHKSAAQYWLDINKTAHYIAREIGDINLANKYLLNDSLIFELDSEGFSQAAAEIYWAKIELDLLKRDFNSYNKRINDLSRLYHVSEKFKQYFALYRLRHFALHLSTKNLQAKDLEREEAMLNGRTALHQILSKEEVVDSSLVWRLYYRMGLVYKDQILTSKDKIVKQKFFKQAEKELFKAYAYASHADKWEDSLRIDLALASSYSSIGRYQQAEEIFLSIAHNYLEHGFINLKAIENLDSLAALNYGFYVKNGDLARVQQALFYQDSAFRSEDRLRAFYQSPDSRQFQNQRRKKQLNRSMAIAEATWRETQDPKAITLALNTIERSRAQELRSELRGLEAQEKWAIPDSIIRPVLLSGLSLAKAKQVLGGMHRDSADYKAQQAVVDRLENENREYRRKLEVAHPAYFKLKFTPDTVSLEALQSKLKHDELLLAYYSTEKYLYTVILSRKEVELRRETLDARFKEAFKRVRTLITTKKLNTPELKLRYQADAHELYKRMLGFLREREEKSLILLPDPKLSAVPFEVLLEENPKITEDRVFRDLPYLWKKYITYYTYSLNLAFAEDKNYQGSDMVDYMGFAPDYGNTQFASAVEERDMNLIDLRLEHIKEEVEAVAQFFRKADLSYQTYLDSLATELEFKQQAPHARILHTAMHSYSEQDNPLSISLLFSLMPESMRERIFKDSLMVNEGELTLSEVYLLNMNADLLILSTCNSNQGNLVVGEGIFSLGRAFRMSSCNNIMASLWNVSDRSSKTMITYYFEALDRGMGKAKALQYAREKYLGQCTNDDSYPFYWAEYILIGNNDPIYLRSWHEQLGINLAYAYEDALKRFGMSNLISATLVIMMIVLLLARVAYQYQSTKQAK